MAAAERRIVPVVLPPIGGEGLLGLPVAPASGMTVYETAYQQQRCERRLAIVPRPAHLFDEPGTLETVTALAHGWFLRHLGPEQEAIGNDVQRPA